MIGTGLESRNTPSPAEFKSRALEPTTTKIQLKSTPIK